METNLYYHELTDERVIILTVYSFGITAVRDRNGNIFNVMLGDLKKIY